MAYVIPSDYTVLEKADMHPGEIETLNYLRKELPSEYTVFHGLHWTNEKATYNVFGEVDFIVINEWGQVLVIEQKDGVLEEGDGKLIKKYGRDRKKNVVGQVLRSKENIQRKLKDYLRSDDIPSIDYLIYLPGYEVVNAMAAGVHPSRVVGMSEAHNLAERICELFSSDRKPSAEHGPRVHDYFCQRLRLVPSIGSFIDAQEKSYARLTEGMAEVVNGLEFSPFRLCVTASAGAGKSQTALQFFKSAQEADQNPLMVCFNRPLADRFAALTKAPDSVMTFYAFCANLLKNAGIDIDFSLSNVPGFWRGILDQVYELTIDDKDRFGCAIIDEGQDFDEEWFELIKCFLKKGAPVLWMEDPKQNLYGKTPFEKKGFVGYHCNNNFRTPSLVGDYICRALDMDIELKNPLPGLAVDVTVYENEADLLRKLDQRVSVLIGAGFSHKDLAIISCKSMAKSMLANQDKVAGITLRKFLGYEEDGRQRYPDRSELVFDTIFRFKGQEKPAVIITEIEDALLQDERGRSLLYCAMTRATVKLDVLVKAGSPWTETLVKARQR